MNELVSVVFTSYNHVEYLEQALNSILEQTYSNLELIIVDDCSTDGSRDVLKKYTDHPKVSLHLLEKNTGSYVKASNYGVKYAKGTYLLFAQCDDFAAPAQIEKLVNAITQHKGLGVAYSKSNLVDEKGAVFANDYDGREKSFRVKCSQDSVITGQEMTDFLFYSCVIPNLSAALIKRELYTGDAVLSEKYLVAADWSLWLEMAQKTDFYYLNEPLNNFRQHATTIRNQVKLTTQVMEIYQIFYNYGARYPLSAGSRRKMKSGAGGTWGWYYFNSPGIWIKSFASLFRKTFSFEKMNLLFLASGTLKIVKEHFSRGKKSAVATNG
ncbi:glycosyltransferase involved in cell wall biosynthesis [Chitinophaga niastensis]|uniref:Glycosyltransferase involved in cell wall biosynthesis n=1 Tax=Chitinophaga niastensis TaxID=536980 RepID=A0A2P8HRW5_CHINA|nr:glycosyltransferase [Chitinophaga niastensis]PSL48938.1 glycosyltransferase involved in cell wall biosynthesis [Chitinophaga niastensis]